jgi:beta-lactamase regulating signal transducer with metallopeptidase domain
MNDLLSLAAHNTCAALVLGLMVFGLTRVWRNPPVAHVLWLLVLLKLVAPPVMRVDWPATWRTERTHAQDQRVANTLEHDVNEAAIVPHFLEQAQTQMAAATAESAEEPAVPTSPPQEAVAPGTRLSWNRAAPVLLWIWLGGAVGCAVLAVVRIARFERLLRDTLPASDRLMRLTDDVARTMGVRPAPQVRYVDGVDVPLLWCAGRRATIALPTRLIGQFDDRSMALILAHELAHLRRRDHWVRAIELLVATIYWWNPLVWAIRQQMHQAEDLCCDAWVRWAFPDDTKRYAEVVLQTAESLGPSQVAARLLPASPFLRSLSLKARIEMILESRFAPCVSRRTMFVVALVAFLLLPLFVQLTKTEALAAPNDEAPAAPAAPCDTSFLSKRFNHRVAFEIGRTQTKDGGRIEIQAVWGTRPQIEVGGQYLVRGKYTLPPGERGKLYFYASASGPWGKTASLDLQSTAVDAQEGEFALVHGMAGPGYFHLILTDPERYSRWFADVYFGSGDNVYRPEPANDSAESTNVETLHLPHKVRFEQGATRFADGDDITILDVHGTAETFAPGNMYRITGTYTMGSHDRATISAYTTAMDSANGRSHSLKLQSKVVDRGDGTFTLYLPMLYRGWPHVSFYPADGGDGFGGNYVGTGDSVLQHWWGEKETK